MVRCRRAQFISGDRVQLSQRWCPEGRGWQPYGLKKKGLLSNKPKQTGCKLLDLKILRLPHTGTQFCVWGDCFYIQIFCIAVFVAPKLKNSVRLSYH